MTITLKSSVKVSSNQTLSRETVVSKRNCGTAHAHETFSSARSQGAGRAAGESKHQPEVGTREARKPLNMRNRIKYGFNMLILTKVPERVILYRQLDFRIGLVNADRAKY